MNKKSKVILLPCNSYREELVYENLETGLELLGSLESIVGKEESVLLKPNLLKKAEVDKAVITHPVIVGMFARLMREKGYQDIILADSCGNGTTTKVIHGTGMDTYLDKFDIPAIDYTKGVHVENPDGIQAKEFVLPAVRRILQALASEPRKWKNLFRIHFRRQGFSEWIEIPHPAKMIWEGSFRLFQRAEQIFLLVHR